MKTFRGRVLSLLFPVALLGCSSLPLSTGNALAQSATGSSADEQSSTDTEADNTSQLMFELMIAELAGRRGQLDVAMEGYLRASERTDDPRVSEQATRLAVFGRQWESAEKAGKRWISLDPDNEEAPGILRQVLLRQGKVDDVSAMYVTLVSEAEERRPVLRAVQMELQRNNDPGTAVAIMQRLADEFGDEAEAHLGLARAFITNTDADAALAASEVALRAAPGDTFALLLNAQILASMDRADEAYASLQEGLADNPDDADLRLGYVQLLVDGSQDDEALSELETLHAQTGEIAEKLLAIGLLAIESGHIEQASVWLGELLDKGVYADQANFYLARINDEQKAYDKAIGHYDEVAEGDLYFNSQVRAAELTALTGDLEQGRMRLQDLALRVSDPLLQTRLIAAESRVLQNADEDAEAVIVLSQGLQQFPDNSDLLYARALAANAAGDNQMMINDLNRLIELDGENAHALNALGYYYADENIELERAEELLVKASALLPEDPAIMDSLGWLRYRQGNYVEAVGLLREAYAMYPDPEIAAHLAAALWRSGAEDEAQALINEALESHPDDERLLLVRDNTFR